MDELRSRLEAFLSERVNASVSITAARQLTGGASRDTWSIDIEVASGPEAGKHALVMRRDMGGEIYEQALSREQEFKLLQVTFAAGVMVPRPRWLCADPAVLGKPFFIMDRIEGESVGRRIVREPSLADARKLLPAQMADQLARIHAIDPKQEGLSFLPRPANGQSPALAAVEGSAKQLWDIGEPHPVLELVIRWLTKYAPSPNELVLVHGDFRIGNLMVGPDGLRAVFDWEFSHVGDPHEDLAWPLVRSWRFGEDRLRLGGICADPEPYFQAYESHSGRKVNREAIHYWEVLGNFRWAVGCIVQANRHLSGKTQSLELASLGRRCAEMELELLNLLR